MAMNHYSWARYRQLRSHVTSLNTTTGERVTVTAPNSPPVSVQRALFFPHVTGSWDPLSAAPPPPGWWENAQVTMAYTFMPNGGAPSSPNEMGQASPPAVDLGFVKLTPHLYPRGTANGEFTCVWTADSREIEFETGRRTDSGSNPTVVCAVWALDTSSVFQNPGAIYDVTFSLVNYGSVLWNSIF